MEGSGLRCIGESVQTTICYIEPCKGENKFCKYLPTCLYYIKFLTLKYHTGPPVMVATFDKKSQLKYAATEINSTLLHVILRFYPFDMSGTILRRFYDDCKFCGNVKLDLIDCHISLTTNFDGCNVSLLSSSTVNVSFIIILLKLTI